MHVIQHGINFLGLALLTPAVHSRTTAFHSDLLPLPSPPIRQTGPSTRKASVSSVRVLTYLTQASLGHHCLTGWKTAHTQDSNSTQLGWMWDLLEVLSLLRMHRIRAPGIHADWCMEQSGQTKKTGSDSMVELDHAKTQKAAPWFMQFKHTCTHWSLFWCLSD